jgi:hypothetical protein
MFSELDSFSQTNKSGNPDLMLDHMHWICTPSSPRETSQLFSLCPPVRPGRDPHETALLVRITEPEPNPLEWLTYEDDSFEPIHLYGELPDEGAFRADCRPPQSRDSRRMAAQCRPHALPILPRVALLTLFAAPMDRGFRQNLRPPEEKWRLFGEGRSRGARRPPAARPTLSTKFPGADIYAEGRREGQSNRM